MALFWTALVRVRVTVVPLTFTAVTALAALFISTEKSSASGVPLTASLVVKVRVLVPPVAAWAVIVGAIPSITNAALAVSEPAVPDEGKVRVALLPAASLIVPPLSASGEMLM